MKRMDLLRQPEMIAVETEEGWKTLPAGGGEEILVLLAIAPEKMEVRVTAKGTRVRHILLQWKEEPGNSVRILGDCWERAYGDLAWRSMEPHRELPWYFMVSDGKRLDGYGVMTGANAFCSWYLDGSYISLLLDVRCGNLGVNLENRELVAAVVVSYEGNGDKSLFEAASDFCRLMCPKPRLPKEPVYGGNNWYYAYGNCSQESYLEDCRILAALSEGLRVRPYMVLDDGWQISHRCVEDCGQDAWLPHPEKFPDMHQMIQKAQKLGVRAGIWYRPLIATKAVCDDWMLARKAQEAEGTRSYKLDPSRPEVLYKIRQEIGQFKEWGFELLKHDFTTYDCLERWGVTRHSMAPEKEWSFFDRTKTTAEILKQLYQVIRESAGDMLILGCNTVSHLSAGVFELNRTGDDISGNQWERTRKMGINTLAFRMPQHGTFYEADADCVGITGKIPWSLNGQWLDLLANSGTPLFISLAPDAASEAVKADIRKAFVKAAQKQEPAQPLDWMDSTQPRIWKCQEGIKNYCWTMPGRIEFCEGYIGE